MFRYMVHTGRNSRSISESELKSYRYYLNDNSNSYVRWKKLIFLSCVYITFTDMHSNYNYLLFFLIPIFKSIILIWMFVPVPIIQNLMCMIKEACIWSCLNIAFTDMYSNFLVFVFFSSIPIFKINRLHSNYLYGCIRESEISTNDGIYFSIYTELACTIM